MMRVLLGLSFFIAFSSACASVGNFELVVTTPVETSLGVSGVRGPVEVWREMIDSAKQEILLGQMYASGKTGEPLDIILTRLEAAAARGVKIRFLLEANMMSASDPATVARLKSIPGLELRVLKFGGLSPGGIIHAKYMVVDGRAAFVGSQNFDWRALKHIHETGVRITDQKIVGQIKNIFQHDWQAWEILQKGGKVPALNAQPLPVNPRLKFYLVASPFAFNPGVSDSETELVRLLGTAKKEVRVTLLDYCPLQRNGKPYTVIDAAVRSALARGVQVKLLVSHWNTGQPCVDHLKSLAKVPGVEVRIMTIPEAREGFIPFARVNHSKFMVIDGALAWVGTSNWAGGYLDRTRNLEVVVKDAGFAEQLLEVHEGMWGSDYSEKIDLGRVYPKPVKGSAGK